MSSNFINDINFDKLKETFINFISIYCEFDKIQSHYILNNINYKLYLYNNKIHDFYNELYQYYKPKSHIYLKREITYSNLCTVVRQICNCLKIKYKYKIKYDNKSYNMIYYIN